MIITLQFWTSEPLSHFFPLVAQGKPWVGKVLGWSCVTNSIVLVQTLAFWAIWTFDTWTPHTFHDGFSLCHVRKTCQTQALIFGWWWVRIRRKGGHGELPQWSSFYADSKVSGLCLKSLWAIQAEPAGPVMTAIPTNHAEPGQKSSVDRTMPATQAAIV